MLGGCGRERDQQYRETRSRQVSKQNACAEGAPVESLDNSLWYCSACWVEFYSCHGDKAKSMVLGLHANKGHFILLLRDKSYESNILACQRCCLLWLRNRHPLRKDPALSKCEYIRRLRSFLFWQPDPSPPFLLPGRGLLKFLFTFVLDQRFHFFWLWSGWACHQIQWLQEKTWSFSRLRKASFCDATSLKSFLIEVFDSFIWKQHKNLLRIPKNSS